MASGTLFSLDRDLAKRVFASKDDASMQALLAELKQNSELAVSLELADYRRLAEHYENYAAKAEASGLAFALLGGRPMHQGPEWIVRLVRPDITRGLADELQRTEVSDAELSNDHAAVASFYAEAAASNAAVLFAAQNSNG